jgi:hypothetical protein
MNPHYDYGTITEAVDDFKSQGFVTDFNLEENCISCEHGKFEADEFEIVKVYRYEGNSDPADEAVVYAIESKTGIKGILVTGFGASSDSASTNILNKLSFRSDH